MITLLIILLIIISVILTAVVLLQSSKGNGLAGPIGGSSVTMAFGVRRTSDLLSKSTSVLAAILMVGCIAVNLMVGNKGTVDETIIQKNAGTQQQNTVPPLETNTPPTGIPDQQQQEQVPVQKNNTDQQKNQDQNAPATDEQNKEDLSKPLEK